MPPSGGIHFFWPMATIHISEAEAYRDFAGVLARVRAGVEVVIEDAASPAVVLRTALDRPLRRLSESLRLAKEHGSTVTLDGGFAHDLEAVDQQPSRAAPKPMGLIAGLIPASLSPPSAEGIQSKN
jgi:antitoxin (DNA-binding transcriptional repressor) of toxin-antitoxin stability system